MATLPTLKLRNKVTGKMRIVNQTTYAMNLGSWDGYDVISARSGDATDKEIRFEQKQEIVEIERVNNPKSPAFGDAKNAYDQRAVTINTQATLEPESAKEFAAVDATPTPDDFPAVSERSVPTIGGSQVVKIGNKKSPGRPKANSQDEVL